LQKNLIRLPFTPSPVASLGPSIFLLNVSFKIFTKVEVNRLTGIAEKLTSPSHTAFMPGRNIMEGVVVLHETIHKLYRKR
jgi:hypothetical protein